VNEYISVIRSTRLKYILDIPNYKYLYLDEYKILEVPEDIAEKFEIKFVFNQIGSKYIVFTFIRGYTPYTSDSEGRSICSKDDFFTACRGTLGDMYCTIKNEKDVQDFIDSNIDAYETWCTGELIKTPHEIRTRLLEFVENNSSKFISIKW